MFPWMKEKLKAVGASMEYQRGQLKCATLTELQAAKLWIPQCIIKENKGDDDAKNVMPASAAAIMPARSAKPRKKKEYIKALEPIKIVWVDRRSALTFHVECAIAEVDATGAWTSNVFGHVTEYGMREAIRRGLWGEEMDSE